MKTRTSVTALLGALSVLAGCAGMPDSAGERSLMITGNDEKVSWNDVGQVFKPGEKHSVSIVDIGTDPLAPKIIVNLPLDNTIMGPPTNLAISPDETIALVANSVNVVMKDRKIALTADNGNAGAADGSTDTVSVIDIEANPPRVIDKLVVGDAPEGLAVSPTGKPAVVALIKGSNSPHRAYFYNRNATVVALKIDGKKVTRSNEVEVRGLPEGVVFSDDGRYVSVGNYNDRDVAILRVDGDQLVNTGKSLTLPGQPGSMRGKTLF